MVEGPALQCHRPRIGRDSPDIVIGNFSAAQVQERREARGERTVAARLGGVSRVARRVAPVGAFETTPGASERYDPCGWHPLAVAPDS